ncbi:OLC1v1031483C1 [Oldenlandia corymbosa var. corymbosa]|uniref:OLC1v1031483C1 n=1 Tax=Oldenlandia corymbosa var. corymbosa TaxID=529605 RepID=A0AAV1CJA9_OLDCO|nr:OLC1v1031483C1 [Oldenlandia corymbosa var. corymbosa]
MREISFGKVEEMDHWSKTSAFEPLPVGRRHNKRKMEDQGSVRFNVPFHRQCKLENVYVYPVSRPAPGAGRETHASYSDHGEVFRMRKTSHPVSRPSPGASLRRTTAEEIHGSCAYRDEADRMRTTSSDLQYRTATENQKGKSGLNPKPVLEQDGTNDDKHEWRVIRKSENAVSSKAPKSCQILEKDDKWIDDRRKMLEKLEKFRKICDSLKNEGIRRIDCEAVNCFKIPTESVLGPISGVEVGDRFNYRMELRLVNLHKPPRAGIGSMVDVPGRRIAVSIVDSGVYDNVREDQKTLIYCGHGGNETNGNRGVSAEDQKPKMGNLALMNSIKAKNDIRVIRGSRGSNSLGFIYDGLYTAEEMWKERNSNGNLIFKFKLVRKPGQPSPFGRRSL